MNKRVVYGTVVVLAAMAAAAPFVAAADITYTWARQNTPLHVHAPAMTCWGGKLYLLGGDKGNGNYTTEVWRYDPSAAAGSEWQKLVGVLPYAGHNPFGQITTAGNQIILGRINDHHLGGRNKVIEYNADGATDGVETAAYPYSDIWSLNLNTSLDGRVYSFGGYAGGVIDKIFKYDPGANTLTELTAKLSVARVVMASVSLPDGRIVLFSGGGYSAGKKRVEVFDCATEQLTSLGDIMPDPIVPPDGLESKVVGWKASCAGQETVFVAPLWHNIASLPPNRPVYRFDPATHGFTQAAFSLPSFAELPYAGGFAHDPTTQKIYVHEMVNAAGGTVDTYLWVGTPSVSPSLLGGEVLLRITGGTLNGTALTPGNLAGQTITVKAGQRITGTVNISVWRGINPGSVFPVIWTPTWGGVPQAIYRQLAANVEASGSAASPIETKFAVKIDLTAPSEGGTEFLVFDTAGEVGSDHVAALSHWEDPTTHWGDTYAPSPNPHPDWGTQIDLATLTDNQYEGMITNGYLSTWWRNKLGQYIELGDHTGGSTHAGDAVRVVVRGKPKLVGHWDFQEGLGSTLATDRSGNGRHGTLVGMEPAEDWVEVTDAGLRPSPELARNWSLRLLPTRSACVDLGVFNVPEHTGTLAMWLKPAPFTTGNHYHVFTKAFDGQSVSGFACYFRIYQDGRMDWGSGLEVNEQRITPPGVVETGKWQHLAVTWSADETIFYKNGVAVARQGGLRIPQHATMPVALARWGALFYPEVAYKGDMDEVRLYSGALSAREIRDLAGNAPAPDFDGDGDVDLSDFLVFQGCFNGPNQPPTSGCGQ